jgi:hypothetical protein
MDPRITVSTPIGPKPSLLTAVGVMTMLSGLVNLGWGIAALGSLFGLLCAPISVLPVILGSFEIGYGLRLLAVPDRGVRPATSIAVLELMCVLFGNLFSVVAGILALVFYNDLAVRAYFEANQAAGVRSQTRSD